VDYLIAFNNDVLSRSTAQINLSKAFLGNRRIWDLHTLKTAQTEDMPWTAALQVALEPGGGHIFAIASETDYQSDQNVILKGRSQNEAGILEIDHELARKSKLNLKNATPLYTRYQEHMKSGEYTEALRLIRQCANTLKTAMKEDNTFYAVQQDLEYTRRTLGRLGGEPEQFQKRLSKAYTGLLGLFWEGQAHSISKEVGQLRAMVEQVEAVAAEGPEALKGLKVDNDALSILEQRAQQYRE